MRRLLVACHDQPGIVAAVSEFLYEAGANITSSQQHSTDPEGGEFFMRMEFTLADAEAETMAARFAETVAPRFGMEWHIHDAERPKRLAVMVSRYDHCLLDLLWRRRRGELHAEIPLVISNHDDLRADVEGFGIPYHHVPVAPEGKEAAEAAQLALLKREGPFDLVVLARYMQILSRDFLESVAAPVINIHHSFLPAFAGAGPYARAKERGVKLVGATAHYVTEELDAGPIIEQDVTRVSHRNSAADIERLGADIERAVLARAVRWHCEDRVIVHANTTVVF